jgi:hypothetical protein
VNRIAIFKKEQMKLIAKDPIEAEPSKPKMVLYGPSGVGKTWFTLGFPNVYYVSPEPGATRKHYIERLRAGGGKYLGPEDGSTDFDVLIDQTKALAALKHDFKTLVVDSITEIFNLTVAKEADRLGSKNAFGADKKPAIAYMRRFVAAINRLDMNVILVAHEKSEWGQDETGQRVEKGKMPDCYDKLIYSLDLAFQAQKRGPSRVSITRKSRLLGFPEGESFPLDFAAFSERYGKDIIEKAATPIVLATVGQVAEIERLVGLLKIEPETVEKWFEKANVEKFSEFTADTADKTIKSLTAKLK